MISKGKSIISMRACLVNRKEHFSSIPKNKIKGDIENEKLRK
mgnify:CR=1 FL=1